MLSKTLFYLLPFVLATGCPYDRCSPEGPASWPAHSSPINLCGATTLTNIGVSTSSYSIASNAISYDPLNLAFVVNPQTTGQPTLSVSNFPIFTSTKSFTRISKSFKLEKILFHCGRFNQFGEGSEHFIQGEQFTGEIQLVHFDSSRFTTFDAAVKSGDLSALLVAAVPLQLLKPGSTAVVPLALTGLIDGLLRAVLALLNQLLGSLKLVGGLPLLQSIPIVNQVLATLGTVINTESGPEGSIKLVPGFVPSALVGPLQHFLPSLAVPAAVDAALSPVTSVVLPVISPLQPTLNAVVVPLSPTLNAILGPLTPLLNNLIIALAPALAPLLCGLGNLLNTLLAPLGLGGLLSGLLGGLNNLLAPLLASILTPVGMLLNGLLGPILSPLLFQLLSSLTPTLDSVLTPVVGTVGNVLIPVTTLSGNLLNQLSGTLGVALGPFTALIGGLVKNLIPIVQTTITTLTGLLGGLPVVGTVVQVLNLNQLFDATAPFYVYPGHLTVHPFPAATWLISSKPCGIDSKLLNKLWSAHGELSATAKKFGTQSLGDLSAFGNFDDLKPAGNRTLLASGLTSAACTPVQVPAWKC